MKLRISKNLIVLIAIALSFLIANNASASYVSSYSLYNTQPIPCLVNTFEVNGSNNANINLNEPVILTWSTSGCNHVYISNYGDVSTDGELTFYPRRDIVYTLSANNSSGYYDSLAVRVYINTNSNYLSQNNSNTQNGTSVVNNYYYPTTSKVSTATNTLTKTSTNTNTTKNTTNSAASSTNSTNGTNNLGASVANSVSQGSGLTALSLKGSGGFMPSSIWQWILVVILILIIIIIVRTLTNKPAPGPEAHAAPHSH